MSIIPKREKKTTFTKREVKTIEEIGAVVREIRKENNLTQEQAALLCGVNPRVLNELETGKPKDFRLKTVLQVVNAFGIVLIMAKRKL